MAMMLSDDTVPLYSTTTLRLQITVNMNQTKVNGDKTSVKSIRGLPIGMNGMNRSTENPISSMVKYTPHGGLPVCMLQKSILV
jgi:hypothetical protein